MKNVKWVIKKSVDGNPVGPVIAEFNTAEEKTAFLTNHYNSYHDKFDDESFKGWEEPYVNLLAVRIEEEITLTQEAYVTGTDQPYYTATAEDTDGNQYQVNWKITHPDFENLEDESEACDWYNPSSIERI